jgi:hypothetical protein
VSVGAGVRRITDDTAFIVEFGIPLPLFDRNQGPAEAASMRHRRSDAMQRAVRVRIDTALAVAHEALVSAQAEVEGLRDAAIPETTVAFDAAQKAYLRGSMRFTDVLDIERLGAEGDDHGLVRLSFVEEAQRAIDAGASLPSGYLLTWGGQFRLVTYLNQLRDSGTPLDRASVEGACRRLRPVLMTAVITALGLIPLLIATGTGSEVQRPLATVVVGGLVTSTALTLLVIPALSKWFAGIPRPESSDLVT